MERCWLPLLLGLQKPFYRCNDAVGLGHGQLQLAPNWVERCWWRCVVYTASSDWPAVQAAGLDCGGHCMAPVAWHAGAVLWPDIVLLHCAGSCSLLLKQLDSHSPSCLVYGSLNLSLKSNIRCGSYYSKDGDWVCVEHPLPAPDFFCIWCLRGGPCCCHSCCLRFFVQVVAA